MAPRVAFYGATGGSVAACLVLALQDGCHCSTLVRSEAKLRTMLTERGISDEVINRQLRVVTGSVKDSVAVRQTLEQGVDIVVSGVGGKPRFSPNPLKPTLDDPTICQDATTTILDALSAVGEPPPHLIVLSTTGINAKARDIPVAMIPLYHWLLAVPHRDKKVMEDMLVAEFSKPEDQRRIRSLLILRPSLLTDGETTSIDHIREGSDEKPQIGYTISRNDVGLWLFEKGIKSAEANSSWRIVSITY